MKEAASRSLFLFPNLPAAINSFLHTPSATGAYTPSGESPPSRECPWPHGRSEAHHHVSPSGHKDAQARNGAANDRATCGMPTGKLPPPLFHRHEAMHKPGASANHNHTYKADTAPKLTNKQRNGHTHTSAVHDCIGTPDEYENKTVRKAPRKPGATIRSVRLVRHVVPSPDGHAPKIVETQKAQTGTTSRNPRAISSCTNARPPADVQNTRQPNPKQPTGKPADNRKDRKSRRTPTRQQSRPMPDAYPHQTPAQLVYRQRIKPKETSINPPIRNEQGNAGIH